MSIELVTTTYPFYIKNFIDWPKRKDFFSIHITTERFVPDGKKPHAKRLFTEYPGNAWDAAYKLEVRPVYLMRQYLSRIYSGDMFDCLRNQLDLHSASHLDRIFGAEDWPDVVQVQFKPWKDKAYSNVDNYADYSELLDL